MGTMKATFGPGCGGVNTTQKQDVTNRQDSRFARPQVARRVVHRDVHHENARSDSTHCQTVGSTSPCQSEWFVGRLLFFDSVGRDGPVDNPQYPAHQLRAAGEQESQLEGKAQHPLAYGLFGEYLVDQQLRPIAEA